MPYLIPANECTIEIEIKRSRFITTVALADTVEKARAFIHEVQARLPNANHYVYAYRVGYGKSVTEGMSDAGEPSGTAGPPTLAVVRGADIGDLVLVTVRYFGGTKLGTGGLVRAYTDAAKLCIESLQTELKIEKTDIEIQTQYRFYDGIQRLLPEYEAEMVHSEFTDTVSLIVQLPTSMADALQARIMDLSAGSANVRIYSSS
ncbi:MAG: YigZ family protein [Anaerolineaceae bacterium]|nr:YigZ family protein [Anaerolineaceae bacterium]